MQDVLDSVMETQHLYRQNAAMKHGVPDPPERIRKRYLKTDQQQSQPSLWSKLWPLLLLLLALALGFVAYQSWQTTPPPPDPTTLLEFLENAGYSR